MGLFEVLIKNMMCVCGANNIIISLTLIKVKLFAPTLNAIFGIITSISLEITPLLKTISA